ncbi:MAG TPA: tetratricopeptide repeat protein [Pirellulales bacterium]|nr:tetratricopeptide repeat protein [Pirellulales bacterium]
MPPAPPQLDEHGFPIPSTFDDRPARRGPSRAFQFVWRTALVLACIAVVLGWAFQSRLANGAKNWLAEQLVRRSLEKVLLNDPSGALGDLNRAASLSPDNPQVLQIRAQLKLTLHDVEGSLEDYNALVKLDRRYAPAYLGRSSALQRLNRHREAIDDLTQAIKLSTSRDATPHNNRAYARAIAGVDLAEALDDVQEAIKIIDEDLRDNQLANRRSLTQAPELKGQKAAYLDTRGYIYFLQSRYEEALADLDQAIQFAEEFHGLRVGHIRAEYQPYFKKQSDQEMSVMYHHRGQVYEKLGRNEEARADLDRATQLGYNPAEGVF